MIRPSSGQATSELILLVPLFVFMAGGALSIGYMCWQGLKVQQAANLAARIQGQERVMGGTSQQSILHDNGLDGPKDQVPDDSVLQNPSNAPINGMQGAPSSGVYGKFYAAVRKMFGPGEQDKLFVPPPVNAGFNTDTVQVVRVLKPPKILNYQLPSIKLEAFAYGGEDPHMYGLPRWGRVDGVAPFYQTEIQNPKRE